LKAGTEAVNMPFSHYNYNKETAWRLLSFCSWNHISHALMIHDTSCQMEKISSGFEDIFFLNKRKCLQMWQGCK